MLAGCSTPQSRVVTSIDPAGHVLVLHIAESVRIAHRRLRVCTSRDVVDAGAKINCQVMPWIDARTTGAVAVTIGVCVDKKCTGVSGSQTLSWLREAEEDSTGI